MKKVLVIDDSQFACMLASQYLESFGYDVKTMINPVGIFSIIRDYKPDAVVVDVNMPGLGGGKLSCKLRQYRLLGAEDYRLILASADNQGFMDDMLETGLVDGYYIKTSTFRGLEHALENAA